MANSSRESPFIKINVKWDRETFEIDADKRKDIRYIKDELHRRTQVVPDRQKLAYKGRVLVNGSTLADARVPNGATLLLVGGTDVVSAPATLPRFVEDMTRQEREAELRRFMEIRHTLSDEERIHVQTFISSIPGLPEFRAYDFTRHFGRIPDEQIFREHLAERNPEAMFLAQQARQLVGACAAGNLTLAKRVALSFYHPNCSPLALAMSGILHVDENPLSAAVASGNKELVRYLIVEGRASPRTCLRWEDQYPIHVAAVHGDVDMCRLLVSHGAQLDSRNGVRETPMHIAIQHNHIQAAEFFFNHFHGRIDRIFKESDVRTWVNTAAKLPTPHIFRYLLEVQRIKPNAADRAGYSPIHHAAATGRTEIVQYLLDECYVPADGIGPEAISSPLLLAVQGGHIEVVRLLVRYGADRRAAMRHAQSNLRHLSNLLLNTEEMDEETRVETQELKDKVTDIMEALQHGAPEIFTLKRLCILHLLHKGVHGGKAALNRELPPDLTDLLLEVADGEDQSSLVRRPAHLTT